MPQSEAGTPTGRFFDRQVREPSDAPRIGGGMMRPAHPAHPARPAARPRAAAPLESCGLPKQHHTASMVEGGFGAML